jgi:hypothetical protein
MKFSTEFLRAPVDLSALSPRAFAHLNLSPLEEFSVLARRSHGDEPPGY